jgi:hypothetical protein
MALIDLVLEPVTLLEVTWREQDDRRNLPSVVPNQTDGEVSLDTIRQSADGHVRFLEFSNEAVSRHRPPNVPSFSCAGISKKDVAASDDLARGARFEQKYIAGCIHVGAMGLLAVELEGSASTAQRIEEKMGSSEACAACATA